jgi:hypothetical protein
MTRARVSAATLSPGLLQQLLRLHAESGRDLLDSNVAEIIAWPQRQQVGEEEYRRYIEPLRRRLGVSDIERFVVTEKR